MSATDPNELDEDAQPNRWPFAIVVSVFLHAVILCEVLISVWPDTPGSAFRPAPLLPIAEKPHAAPAVAEKVVPILAPEPEPPAIIASPTDTAPPPKPVVAAAPAPTVVPPVAPRRHAAVRHAPASTVAPAPAPTARPPSVEPAPYAYPRPEARRAEAAPAYASVGDWFRAMSRMRQGDFAPSRRP